MAALFKRDISKQLIEFIKEKSKTKNVGLLSGARQVGKTTLLLAILQDFPHLYLNLEKTPSVAAQMDRCAEFQDLEDYLRDEHGFDPLKKILVIDEAQLSAKLGSFVRFMKEEWRGATVLLTGSLLSELFGKREREAVGRETFFEMWPMTFKEFLMALQQDALVKTMEEFQLGEAISEAKHERFMDYFNQYLKVGGLPEVVSYFKDSKDYERRRADIFKAYENDFVRYFSLDEVNLFRRCLESVAANLASPSKDSQVVGLDRPGYKKISGIFARLEKWKLLIKCEQLGLEPEKNKFFPKRYLYDVGIAGQLRLKGLPDLELRDLGSPTVRTPLGGLLENAVALSLRVQFGENLYGVKMSSRAEVDFVFKKEGQVFPLECKTALRFKGSYLWPLQTYLEKTGSKKKQLGILLYAGMPRVKSFGPIWALPLYFSDEIGRLTG